MNSDTEGWRDAFYLIGLIFCEFSDDVSLRSLRTPWLCLKKFRLLLNNPKSVFRDGVLIRCCEETGFDSFPATGYSQVVIHYVIVLLMTGNNDLKVQEAPFPSALYGRRAFFIAGRNMMKHKLMLTIAGAILLTAVFVLKPGKQSSVSAKPSPLNEEKAVSKFMRAKLSSSQKILEGLVTEDYGMIEKGAQELVLMSKASDWQVIEGPVYSQYSSEFRRSAEQLIKTAQEKNTDGAALSYMHVTMSCVNCHKFVRSTQVAAGEAVSPGLQVALKADNSRQ